MYTFSDYAHRGMLLINNTLFKRRKKLSSVMLYSTDLCNSKCLHCYIWQKQPKQSMPLSSIKKIVESSAVTKRTKIGLEGGEFLLHPEANEILDYMTKNHPNFDLLSNCVNPSKLIDLCEKYLVLDPNKKHKFIPRLYISLDGKDSTHEKIRGVKGVYPKVIEVIEALHKKVPISVMFTLTPFNSFEDLVHVGELCKKYNVDMRVGIYNNMEYFETKETAHTGKGNTLDYKISEIPEIVKNFEENYDFMMPYQCFRNGELKLPCLSIKDSIVIYPNGDVPLCQNKQKILGNVNNEPLEKIINKPESVKCHKDHRRCNECWVNFHRKYDIVLYRGMEKILPKKIIEMFFGKYQWNKNKNQSYSKTLKTYGKD
ncbi:MAG: radical SAM protein [Bacteroidales bacterium]|nr:radical SAM protein [Bacteroidales bacterium]